MNTPACHPQLKYKALGMCATCYGKSRVHLLPRATCHPDRPKITRDGLCQLCSDRRYYSDAEKRVKRAAQRRPRQIASKYGLSTAQFELMKREQGDLCAICRKPQKSSGKSELCIDHDHVTGVIRGLLCDKCNRAIGLLGDSLDIVAAAFQYLKKFTTAPNDKGSVGQGCDA